MMNTGHTEKLGSGGPGPLMEELMDGGAAVPGSSVCLLYTTERGDGLLYMTEHGGSITSDKQGGRVIIYN